jgi:hypothetical protein
LVLFLRFSGKLRIENSGFFPISTFQNLELIGKKRQKHGDLLKVMSERRILRVSKVHYRKRKVRSVRWRTPCDAKVNLNLLLAKRGRQNRQSLPPPHRKGRDDCELGEEWAPIHSVRGHSAKVTGQESLFENIECQRNVNMMEDVHHEVARNQLRTMTNQWTNVGSDTHCHSKCPPCCGCSADTCTERSIK